jgi:hypothetical protein
VATKPSIVAMFGRIMPAPLLMPVTVDRRAAELQRVDAALGTVSVVMIASAARPSRRPRVGDRRRQRGLDAVVRQRLHDHAGGKRQHLLRRAAEPRAERAQVERARASPSSPVPALALPVLTRIARTSARGEVLAADLHRRGAESVGGEDAGDRRPGSSRTTVTSRRFALRTPAMAVPRVTPARRKCPSLQALAIDRHGDVSPMIEPILRTLTTEPSRDMPHFFIELVSRTDEARRAFESHPIVLDAVANGLSLDRYRVLLSSFTASSCTSIRAAPQRRAGWPTVTLRCVRSSTSTCTRNQARGLGARRPRGRRSRPRRLCWVTTVAPCPRHHGYNYWAADRKHPCSILGMMYVLEVIASVYGGPFSAAMRESLLLQGDRGISFISSHATMDAEHMAHCARS